MTPEEFMTEEMKKEKQRREAEVIWNQIIPNKLMVICKSYKEDVIMNLGNEEEDASWPIEIKSLEAPQDLSQTTNPFELTSPKIKVPLKYFEAEAFQRLESLDLGTIRPVLFDSITKFIKTKKLREMIREKFISIAK